MPVLNSPWTTVGSGGKSAGGVSTPVRAPPTVVASVPTNHATIAAKSSPAVATRSVASVVRPATAGKIEDFPVSPSHDFLKWLSESLKGLNNSVNGELSRVTSESLPANFFIPVEEIIAILLSFSLDPDPSTVELISDTIYANSTTLDGRRFAAEFVAKRKLDAANRARGGVSAAKGPSKPISIAEVVKATPKATQAEWGFKVVNKKKKGGRA